MSIEDVTDRVKAAVQSNMSADDANKARANVMAQIEKESREKTGLRSDVVTLRSEEHTSELQSQSNLVCRLLLEKKKKKSRHTRNTMRFIEHRKKKSKRKQRKINEGQNNIPQ